LFWSEKLGDDVGRVYFGVGGGSVLAGVASEGSKVERKGKEGREGGELRLV